MSLKVFHVIFILVAIALMVVCAWWSFANQVALPFGIAAVALAVALAIYGVWFLKKAKNIIT